MLKLYATMAAAAREVDDGDIANRFFVVSSYLSTATVLYKRGGFTPRRSPSCASTRGRCRSTRSTIPASNTTHRRPPRCWRTTGSDLLRRRRAVRPDGQADAGRHSRRRTEPRRTRRPTPDADGKAGRGGAGDGHGPAGLAPPRPRRLGRHRRALRVRYPRRSPTSGRTSPPTSNRATCRASPTGSSCCRTNGATCCCGRRSPSPAWPRCRSCSFPLIFGWRTIFSRNPGKFRTIIYFACLGAGYIMVEVGLISDFMLALSNATVSASVLITGMLVFSGLGAFVSERYLDRARSMMPKIFIAIGVLLVGYGLFLDRVLDLIGTLPYAAAAAALLRADLSARVPDGLPDADRDDVAGAARQGSHVPVGLGHQRLLLRHRRGRRCPSSRPRSG